MKQPLKAIYTVLYFAELFLSIMLLMSVGVAFILNSLHFFKPLITFLAIALAILLIPLIAINSKYNWKIEVYKKKLQVKEKCLKTYGLICFILLLQSLLSIIASLFIKDGDIAYTLFGVCFCVFIIFSIPLVLYPFLPLTIIPTKNKAKKAIKMLSPYKTFDEFSEYIEPTLAELGYLKQSTRELCSDAFLNLFVMPYDSNVLNCFAIVRAEVLTDEIVTHSNDTITNLLKDCYYRKEMVTEVNMISVFCVDRITSAFKTIVDTPVEQGYKNGRFNVGISFGGKNVYIALNDGLFLKSKYKKSKEMFYSLTGISEKKH